MILGGRLVYDLVFCIALRPLSPVPIGPRCLETNPSIPWRAEGRHKASPEQTRHAFTPPRMPSVPRPTPPRAGGSARSKRMKGFSKLGETDIEIELVE